MSFHHSVTIYLMIGSYMFNVWECGAVISFIHDFTDMVCHFLKASSHTTFDVVTIPTFIFFLLSWGYMRNIILPICIYQNWNSGVFAEYPILLPIYCYFLSCLVILHYYWYSIFLKILYKLATEGATDDLQNKVVMDDNKKEEIKEKDHCCCCQIS